MKEYPESTISISDIGLIMGRYSSKNLMRIINHEYHRIKKIVKNTVLSIKTEKGVLNSKDSIKPELSYLIGKNSIKLSNCQIDSVVKSLELLNNKKRNIKPNYGNKGLPEFIPSIREEFYSNREYINRKGVRKFQEDLRKKDLTRKQRKNIYDIIKENVYVEKKKSISTTLFEAGYNYSKRGGFVAATQKGGLKNNRYTHSKSFKKIKSDLVKKSSLFRKKIKRSYNVLKDYVYVNTKKQNKKQNPNIKKIKKTVLFFLCAALLYCSCNKIKNKFHNRGANLITTIRVYKVEDRFKVIDDIKTQDIYNQLVSKYKNFNLQKKIEINNRVLNHTYYDQGFSILRMQGGELPSAMFERVDEFILDKIIKDHCGLEKAREKTILKGYMTEEQTIKKEKLSEKIKEVLLDKDERKAVFEKAKKLFSEEEFKKRELSEKVRKIFLNENKKIEYDYENIIKKLTKEEKAQIVIRYYLNKWKVKFSMGEFHYLDKCAESIKPEVGHLLTFRIIWGKPQKYKLFLTPGSPPKNLEEEIINTFKNVFVVSKKEKTLSIYTQGTLQETQEIATGKNFRDREVYKDFTTPEGVFLLTAKQWSNDELIKKGYGPCRIFVDVRYLWGAWKSSIWFHGTSNPASIGTDASEGCIRVHNDNIIKYYNQFEFPGPIMIIKESEDHNNKYLAYEPVKDYEKKLHKEGFNRWYTKNCFIEPETKPKYDVVICNDLKENY